MGTEEQKEKYAPSIIKAEKKICLAITEPTGGSDVSGIRTTAVKDPSGEFYIVNGSKTFIRCVIRRLIGLTLSPPLVLLCLRS